MTNRDTEGTVNKICAMPMASTAPTAPVHWGVNHRSTLHKMDGGTIPIEHKESNFKDRDFDGYTGEVLPKHWIRESDRRWAELLEWQSVESQFSVRNGTTSQI